MASELIATGKGAANSADFTLADAESANIFLKFPADSQGMAPEMVYIEIKDSAGRYTPVCTLGQNLPGVNIAGPGIFRVRRIDALSQQIGVERG